MENGETAQMAHTPGPWAVAEDDFDGSYYVLAPDNGIAEYRIAEQISQPRASDGRDDAILIAAAPDLLEALDQLLDDMGENGLSVCQAAKDQAKVALAKARGETVK